MEPAGTSASLANLCPEDDELPATWSAPTERHADRGAETERKRRQMQIEMQQTLGDTPALSTISSREALSVANVRDDADEFITKHPVFCALFLFGIGLAVGGSVMYFVGFFNSLAASSDQGTLKGASIVITTSAPTLMTTDAPTAMITGASTSIITSAPTLITTDAPTAMEIGALTSIATGAPTLMTTDAPTAMIITGASTWITTEASTQWLATIAKPKHYTYPKLRWLHVPKCGQSFATTFLRYLCPGVRVETIAKVLAETTAHDGTCKSCRLCCVVDHFPVVKQNSTCRPSRFGEPFAGHLGLKPDDQGVTMLRKPSQRIISHYLSFRASGNSSAAFLKLRSAPSLISKFAHNPKSQSLVSKMLLGYNFLPKKNSDFDIQKKKGATEAAIDATKKLAFVGLVEKWDCSIKLFHAMFTGLEASKAEFKNIHTQQTAQQLHSGYPEHMLDGYVDTMDEAVYRTASELFTKRIKVYNVSGCG